MTLEHLQDLARALHSANAVGALPPEVAMAFRAACACSACVQVLSGVIDPSANAFAAELVNRNIETNASVTKANINGSNGARATVYVVTDERVDKRIDEAIASTCYSVTLDVDGVPEIEPDPSAH